LTNRKLRKVAMCRLHEISFEMIFLFLSGASFSRFSNKHKQLGDIIALEYLFALRCYAYKNDILVRL